MHRPSLNNRLNLSDKFVTLFTESAAISPSPDINLFNLDLVLSPRFLISFVWDSYIFKSLWFEIVLVHCRKGSPQRTLPTQENESLLFYLPHVSGKWDGFKVHCFWRWKERRKIQSILLPAFRSLGNFGRDLKSFRIQSNFLRIVYSKSK